MKFRGHLEDITLNVEAHTPGKAAALRASGASLPLALPFGLPPPGPSIARIGREKSRGESAHPEAPAPQLPPTSVRLPQGEATQPWPPGGLALAIAASAATLGGLILNPCNRRDRHRIQHAADASEGCGAYPGVPLGYGVGRGGDGITIHPKCNLSLDLRRHKWLCIAEKKRRQTTTIPPHTWSCRGLGWIDNRCELPCRSTIYKTNPDAGPGTRHYVCVAYYVARGPFDDVHVGVVQHESVVILIRLICGDIPLPDLCYAKASVPTHIHMIRTNVKQPEVGLRWLVPARILDRHVRIHRAGIIRSGRAADNLWMGILGRRQRPPHHPGCGRDHR